jgi:hypothetical protein
MRLKRKTAERVAPAVGEKLGKSFSCLYNDLSRFHENPPGGALNIGFVDGTKASFHMFICLLSEEYLIARVMHN